jgi:hypothetical protein
MALYRLQYWSTLIYSKFFISTREISIHFFLGRVLW